MAPLAVACALALGCGEGGRTASHAHELVPPALSTVLEGLPRVRPLPVELVTDRGTIPCELAPESKPRASALFLGFALGRAAWKSPQTGEVSRLPLYRDLPFVRGVPGALIQSGDPVGNTTGHPGYRIPVEPSSDDAALLAEPGALVLARYTLPPNRRDPHPPPAGHVLGSQFALLLTRMPHLSGQVTVLGRCHQLEIARAIARSVGEDTAAHRARPILRQVRVRPDRDGHER